jgi:hypothetical protein
MADRLASAFDAPYIPGVLKEYAHRENGKYLPGSGREDNRPLPAGTWDGKVIRLADETDGDL